MTKREFVEIFRRQYGYEPEGEELDLLLDEYHVDDDEGLPPPRQQSKVYQFSSNNYSRSNDNPVDDLLKEIKNIFLGIGSSAKRSASNSNNENFTEFSFMLVVFLLKAGLYFCLKEAYSRGFDFTNL
jgi:hypothetical protein